MDEYDQLDPFTPKDTEETLKWYAKNANKRDGSAEEIRADEGEVEFKIGETLRNTWIAAQRIDPTLSQMFRNDRQA